MTATAKFICPICYKEICVDWFDLRREPFREVNYYAFRCPKCKRKLTVNPDEFERNRVDG